MSRRTRTRRGVALAVAAAAVCSVGAVSSSAAPTVSAADCTVSDILVPSCGAWSGASTAPKSGTLTGSGYATGLKEWETLTGNTPDILHFYKNGAQKFPTSTEIGMAERAGKQRSLLFYNWKPNSKITWRAVTQGQADSNIATVAAAVKKYPHKIFMTLEHEPEPDVGGSGRSAADYVAFYRYVVNKMEKTHGVKNVVWVMNYMGYYGWSNVWDGIYPGNDYVDWIAYDPYGIKHNTFAEFLNTAKGGSPGFYNWATKKAPGKPLMLAEWGWDLKAQPNAPRILDDAMTSIQQNFPMVKAYVYWHDDAGNFSVRLDQSTTTGRAYRDAYKRMVNHAYFNSTPTSAAP